MNYDNLDIDFCVPAVDIICPDYVPDISVQPIIEVESINDIQIEALNNIHIDLVLIIMLLITFLLMYVFRSYRQKLRGGIKNV